MNGQTTTGPAGNSEGEAPAPPTVDDLLAHDPAALQDLTARLLFAGPKPRTLTGLAQETGIPLSEWVQLSKGEPPFHPTTIARALYFLSLAGKTPPPKASAPYKGEAIAARVALRLGLPLVTKLELSFPMGGSPTYTATGYIPDDAVDEVIGVWALIPKEWKRHE